MCGPKGYGFSAVLLINRVLILGNHGHKLDMFFFSPALIWVSFKAEKPRFHHYRKENQQKSFINYVHGNLTLE